MKRVYFLAIFMAFGILVVACGGAESLDPGSVSIDTLDLPYSWQANLVEATAYDDSQPPGAMGLPEHMQINFGVTDPGSVQFGDPIIYIIPTEAYKQLWDAAGNPVVSDRLGQTRSGHGPDACASF
jgi:hypothetical protein